MTENFHDFVLSSLVNTHLFRKLFTSIPALFIPWPKLAYISGTLVSAPPTPALPPPRVTLRWTARDRARWTGPSCRRRTAQCGSGGTFPAAQRKGNPPLNKARRPWTKEVGVHCVSSLYIIYIWCMSSAICKVVWYCNMVTGLYWKPGYFVVKKFWKISGLYIFETNLNAKLLQDSLIFNVYM